MLDKIDIPLFLLHAGNDPIVRDEIIPYEYLENKINKNIIFAWTEQGGHIAWHEGLNDRWYPKPALEFMNLSKNQILKTSHKP